MSVAWYWPDWQPEEPEFGPDAYKNHSAGCQCPDCKDDDDA